MTRLLYLFMPHSNKAGHPSNGSLGMSYDIERISGDLPDVMLQQDDSALGMNTVVDEGLSLRGNVL